LPDWLNDIVEKPQPMPVKGDKCFANIQTEIIAHAADARNGAAYCAIEFQSRC